MLKYLLDTQSHLAFNVTCRPVGGRKKVSTVRTVRELRTVVPVCSVSRTQSGVLHRAGGE